MSVLTKLFVVLLVVCALLLTAATTVFVNRVDDFRASLKTANATNETLKFEKQNSMNQAAAAQAMYDRLLQDRNAEVTRLNGEIAKGRQDAGGLQTRLGDLTTQLNVALAANTTQGQALKALEAQLAARSDQYKTAVTELDETRKRNAELNATNTDFEKQLSEAERERRFLNEQVIQLQADKNRLRGLLVENRINPDSPVGPSIRTAPKLSLTINKVEQKDGQTYATIGAGTNDKVSKGMQFTIVDPQTSDFIGILTIEQVDEKEAWGRIEGPKVNEAKKDDQALSKI